MNLFLNQNVCLFGFQLKQAPKDGGCAMNLLIYHLHTDKYFRKYVYKYLTNLVKKIWNKAMVVVDQPEVEFLDLGQN